MITLVKMNFETSSSSHVRSVEPVVLVDISNQKRPRFQRVHLEGIQLNVRDEGSRKLNDCLNAASTSMSNEAAEEINNTFENELSLKIQMNEVIPGTTTTYPADSILMSWRSFSYMSLEYTSLSPIGPTIATGLLTCTPDPAVYISLSGSCK
jgi:hypothetical protein